MPVRVSIKTGNDPGVTSRAFACTLLLIDNSPLNPPPAHMSDAVMDPVATIPSPRVQILRLPQVCKTTGLCRSLLYQLEAEDLFPKRVRLTARAVGWIESEVQSWLASRIVQSRGELERSGRGSRIEHAIGLDASHR
jgi:prophage regulatory protein